MHDHSVKGKTRYQRIALKSSEKLIRSSEENSLTGPIRIELFRADSRERSSDGGN